MGDDYFGRGAEDGNDVLGVLPKQKRGDRDD